MNKWSPLESSCREKIRFGRDAIVLFYEQENVLHTQGVAQILLEEAQKTLTEWGSHESGIIEVSFKAAMTGRVRNLIPIHDMLRANFTTVYLSENTMVKEKAY